MSEEQFSAESWKAIFGREVPYPTGLPDPLVREIASLRIYLQDMASTLEAGLRNRDRLLAFMPLSLASGTVKRMAEFVEETLTGEGA